MPNVSSAKGKRGAKKPAQKHRNTFAFKPLSHNPVAVAIASLPARGMCKRCMDIVEWRKRMNKYKPLTQPKTCAACHQRTITDAYHVLCQGCARVKGQCAKCGEVPAAQGASLLSTTIPTAAEELRSAQETERKLASLNERNRRSYLRRKDKGDEEGAQRILERAGEANDDSDDFFSDDENEDDEDDVEGEGEGESEDASSADESS